MHYSLTRATAWNLAGYIYLLVASFISTPILIHNLGLSQFGTYSLVVGTFMLVSALNLGLPQAVMRALSQKTSLSPARRTIWATSSSLFILSGCFAGLLAVVLTLFLHLPSTVYLTIFSIGLLNSIIDHYLTLPQAEGHFGYFNTKTFIVGTGNTLMTAFLAWIGQGIATILAMQLLTYLLTLLPLVYFSLKFFPDPRQGKSSKNVAKSLIIFGIKSQAGTIVGQIQAQYAKYLLAAHSPLTLSAYVIAQGLIQKSTGGIFQFATALYPASVRQTGRPGLRSLYHRLQASFFILALISMFLYHIIGYPFLSWWLHDIALVTQVDAVLKVMLWYFIILIFSPLASTILDSHGRPEITSFFAFLTTAIEITFALILFPHYHLLAPAIAALIAALFTTPMLLIATERVITTDIHRIRKHRLSRPKNH